MSSTTDIAGLSSYLEAFTGLQERGSRQPEWLRSLRQEAFSRFCDVGFPTTKDEDWRFTNVSQISDESFSLVPARRLQLTGIDIQPLLIAHAAGSLVFVNGRFAPELSAMRLLPSGIEAGSLAEEILNPSGALELHLGRYLDIHRDPFNALNTAFIEDGAYVRIQRGVVLEAPVHLLFISTGLDGQSMIHPRNLLVAEPGAQISVIEEHVSLNAPADGRALFSNIVTELVAAENATVSHHMIERQDRSGLHVSTLRIQQERDSNVRSHSVLVGGALVRNNVHPVLAGEGGECLINGLFIGVDRQHLDNYMLVEHASPHCASHQFYNGILSGRSHGVFHGRIIVHKDAQKTDAKQTNRNLLLSDEAQIDTKPQLEIYADDVKCTHGATIGQIDEDALYYLRCRGIEESAARELLLFAFAGECLGRIQSAPVREHMERIARRSLPEGTSFSGGGPDAERHWEEVG